MLRYLLILVALLVGCTKETETAVKAADHERQAIGVVPLRACYSATGGPLQRTLDGKPNGIAIETLSLVAERVEIPIVYVSLPTQAAVIEAMEKKTCDLAVAVRPTPERAEFMGFSKTYLSFGTTMLVQELPITFPMKVGFARRHTVQLVLQNMAKQVDVVIFDNDEESFKALMKREISGAVIDELYAEDLEKRFNKKFAHSKVNFTYDISFAYAKNNPTLGVLLDRGLDTILEKEKKQIRLKYTTH